MSRLQAGILGCTGIVGQQFVRLLDGHPYFELRLLAASARSAGKPYGQSLTWVVDGNMPEASRDLVVIEAELGVLLESGIRFFFSALPARAAGPLETALREKGCLVFSNAAVHRMDDDVPILIPEVNPEHWKLAERQMSRFGGCIVTGSNCSTSGLTMTLKPLEPFGIQRVSVTTFQSISGAGRRGLAALDIEGNVIPFIRDEEEKIACETRKILGVLNEGKVISRRFEVRSACCRVPVREGHLLSIEMEFRKEPDPAAVLKALHDFRSLPQELGLPTAPDPPLLVRTEEDRPQPILDVRAGSPERARGMAGPSEGFVSRVTC